jgi:hypothetical protein
LHADSHQSDICAYLSIILVAGLALNAFFWLVLGRSGCGIVHGSHHREGRSERAALRPLHASPLTGRRRLDFDGLEMNELPWRESDLHYSLR